LTVIAPAVEAIPFRLLAMAVDLLRKRYTGEIPADIVQEVEETAR
jgi:hypothetical protein